MEYKIVKESYSTDLLAKKVNEMIREGWRPQGGVCLASAYYLQAMVK